MAVIVTVDQKVDFSVSFVDSAGNPAKVDEVLLVTLSDPNVADLVVNADGLSGTVSAKAVGTCQVQVDADADLGAGVRSLVVLGDVEVVAGEAVVGTVTFGAPQPK